MLSHEKLVELYRELRGEKVLSVYLDVDQRDPAERNKWKVRLEQEVNRCRRELNGDDGERRRFDEAWNRLRAHLEDGGFVAERGWVGFATPEQVWYVENVPVPMPDGVYWEEGIRVAPYVRGLKQERPVVLVLVDSRRARIFRYRSGEVTELEDPRADTFFGDLTDVNVSKRAVSHSGVRGETATEAAQRALEVSADRMVKHVAELVTELAGSQGFLLVGGVTEAVSRALPALPKQLESRVMELSSLPVEAPLPEIRQAIESAASQLTQRYQAHLLEAVVEQAGAGGRACLGREATGRALEEMRVETLLLSRNLIKSEPDLVDRWVGAALAQDAGVEELSEQGAERLDGHGGVGARLRYVIRSNGHSPEQETAGDQSDFHR